MVVLYFIIAAEYLSTKDGGNCCIANPSIDHDTVDNFHRNCVCDEISSPFECEKMCSNDANCKGFTHTIINQNPLRCQLATSSKCPDKCRGPYQPENVGPIDEHPMRCSLGFYAGCSIKQIGKDN